MNNDELKKKIVEVLEETYEPIEYGDKDCVQIYFPTHEDVADALIAAGIGDVSVMKEIVEFTIDQSKKERRNLIELQNIQLDDLNNRLKHSKHRAEVAEKQAEILSEWLSTECKEPNTTKVWKDMAYLRAKKELKGEEK